MKGTAVFEHGLHNGGSLADRFNAFRGDRTDDPRRQCRPRKRDTVKQRFRQAQGLAQFPDPILTQLNQGLEDAIPENFLRIDTELLKHIVLPFNTGDSLIHIGQDGALQQAFRPTFANNSPEHFFVEGLCDGLAFFFGVYNPCQGVKKFLPCINHFHLDPKFLKKSDHLFRFPFAHNTVFNKHRS